MRRPRDMPTFLSTRRLHSLVREIVAVVALACGLGWTQAAYAATIWTFDLPATGIPSQNPPYPTVATLTLTQTPQGVQFVLDPNEGSPGFTDKSFVERLDYVYAGAPLTGADFTSDAGVPATFEFESNPNNVDAGYKAGVFHIIVDFPSKNDPDRFNPTDTSTWTVHGTTLSDFTDALATANNKPNPIYGVISVTAYSLPDPHPTPSNWVSAVPEPGTGGLLLLGLSLLRSVWGPGAPSSRR